MPPSLRTKASFRIAILADFSGQIRRPDNPRPMDPVKIDADNFDAVFRRFRPSFIFPLGKGAGELELQELADFHPDHLLNQAESLSRLVQLREKILSNAEDAETELLKLWPVQHPPESPKAEESEEETLARLLGRDPQPRASSVSAIDSFIKKLVAPSVVTSASAKQAQLVSLAEAELTKGLVTILHAPQFQALEATWRAVDFLVRGVCDEIELYLVNLDKGELQRALPDEEISRTVLGKQLQELGPAFVLGDYSFDDGDFDLLASIGRMALWLGSAFVAGASPQLVGCPSFASRPDPDDWENSQAGWEKFRLNEAAKEVALVLPRFLLRQPYGKRSDPIETFPFEEMAANPEHESFLWGNSAFLYGQLLAEAGEREFEEEDNEGSGTITGLPVYQYKSEGETKVKPCAEAWLSERAAEVILADGIMPILSARGSDGVRLWPIRSCANPSTGLAVRGRTS